MVGVSDPTEDADGDGGWGESDTRLGPTNIGGGATLSVRASPKA